MSDRIEGEQIEGMLDSPGVAEAVRSEHFRDFLDGIPVAIAVSELGGDGPERLAYVNHQFVRLTGVTAEDIEGSAWSDIPAINGIAGRLLASDDQEDDYVGSSEFRGADGLITLDWWANVIRDDIGQPNFRVVAAAEATDREREDMIQRLRDKDTLLRELQHRVSNSLQMVTALIRLEARNLPADTAGGPLERLASRVAALSTLYRSLSEGGEGDTVDLGTYLSQIASTVMQAHAPEGIRLDLKVDTWSVSVNVAMPTGLIVNELLTNALKHAFCEEEGGTITVHSLVDDDGCTVVVADDGRGLPEGASWPQPGKLGFLITQSLEENSGAKLNVVSRPGGGVRAMIRLPRGPAVHGT